MVYEIEVAVMYVMKFKVNAGTAKEAFENACDDLDDMSSGRHSQARDIRLEFASDEREDMTVVVA